MSSCTTTSPTPRSGEQVEGVGGPSSISRPEQLVKSGSRNCPLMGEDELGLNTPRNRVHSLEICSDPGEVGTNFLDAKIANIIEGVSDSIGFRTKAVDTKKRRLREVRKILNFCKTSKAKSASDSIVLYASGRLGQGSGERLVACCNQVMGALSLVGIKFEDDVQGWIREIMRYANLLCPPETIAANPVSLKTIFNLMDLVEQRGATNIQAKALDVLLFAYAAMSRLGEVAALRVGDVIIPKSDEERLFIHIHTKTTREKGLQINKLVLTVKGERSWCPRLILLAYVTEAQQDHRSFVFPNSDDVAPSVSSLDKALQGLTRKLLPNYKLRISGHSAQKGAALGACIAGVPEALIQAQGGWKDPATWRVPGLS